MKLTEEQKGLIVQRSIEAQHFLNSDLYHELEKWITQEKEFAVAALATNNRTENEKSMTRSEFMESKAQYYLALEVVKSVFKGWAQQQEELKKVEEHERSKTQG